MKIAVIGAGAIGSVLGGLLAHHGHDVTLIGRQPHVGRIQQDGLSIDGVLGHLSIPVTAAETLDFAPDVAIIATKTQDVRQAILENKEVLRESSIITIQNGIQASHIAAELLGKHNIFSGVILFGATFLEPGKVTYSPRGSIVLGHAYQPDDKRVQQLAELFNEAIPTVATTNITGAHWTKLVMNENNALLAITNLPLQEAMRHKSIQTLSVLMMREAIRVIHASGAQLAPLPGVPIGIIAKLLFLPLPIARSIPKLSAQRMGQLPVLGSTLQSIRKGEPTEIDYLNGEVISLGKRHAIPTPINTKIVELVHQVAKNRQFLTPDQLSDAFRNSR